MRPGVVWFGENLDAQLIGQVNLGVKAATEKVGCLHTKIPQKSTLYKTFREGIGAHHLHKKAYFHAGLPGFAGQTY